MRIAGRRAGVVLVYHRVAELAADPQLLAVSPRLFSEHLDVLRRDYHPLHLSDMVAAARAGALPERAVAVTFDDGYADNLHEARPVLDRHDVPATVFITSDYVGSEREFWWDDLERILLLPATVPDRLLIRFRSITLEWAMTEPDSAGAPRERAYRSLLELLRGLTGAERRAVLEDLARQVGVTTSGRRSHRALSESEIIRLIDGGNITVGAHTRTHPSLGALPPSEQQSEIAGSRARLQEITGTSLSSFAFPFGGSSDYSRVTVALVREAGFSTSYINSPGLVHRVTDPFRVPRLLVRNWDAETFTRRLRDWLGSAA
jgi:peptidoglycan/xylan/chitin deacetylase (PgdA/CDA1 family)